MTFIHDDFEDVGPLRPSSVKSLASKGLKRRDLVVVMQAGRYDEGVYVRPVWVATYLDSQRFWTDELGHDVELNPAQFFMSTKDFEKFMNAHQGKVAGDLGGVTHSSHKGV